MKYLLALLLAITAAARAGQPATPLKIALIQSRLTWGDPEAGLNAFEKRVEACESCDLIVLPELFASGCEMKKKDARDKNDLKKKVAALYPQVIRQMQQWARSRQAVIIGSTICQEEDRFYNRLLAVYPDGSYRTYDKHNCFKRGAFTPGTERLVFEWKGHRFSTFICYDLRFAEWCRNADNTYDTAIYIANWPASRHDDWKRLLQERAMENRAYAIGVNCVGKDPAGIEYTGGSCLITPEGKTCAVCPDGEESTVYGYIGHKP